MIVKSYLVILLAVGLLGMLGAKDQTSRLTVALGYMLWLPVIGRVMEWW